jgi:hypothetical protein
MVTDPRARPYRVWLYRKHREVRLDGQCHLVWLNLRTDDEREQEANQERLHTLFDQIVRADGGSGWDRDDSQLRLTAEMDEAAPLTSANTFWWTPGREERR